MAQRPPTFPLPPSVKWVQRCRILIQRTSSLCLCVSFNSENDSWQTTERCEQCSLDYQGGSIECRKDGLYFLYAQVAFEEPPDRSHHNRKSVILKRNPAQGKSLRKLAEGTFSSKTEGSVWVANVVRLRKGDKISINITGEYLYDTTVWGAYELH